jgi:hypothetical protein
MVAEETKVSEDAGEVAATSNVGAVGIWKEVVGVDVDCGRCCDR